MTTTVGVELRREFVERGFVIIPEVLDDALRTRLIETTDRVVDDQQAEHGARNRTTGSMVPISSDPLYPELITLPSALRALAALGWDRPRFSDGWVISKPGGGPRLFWHYDWFTWQDDVSLRPEPCQISLMYYLNSTRRENGCLRVIPGSHNTHNPLHDVLSRDRGELSAGADPDAPEFGDRPDEVDVPIKAGDLLVTDARLLHAGHANNTDERRRLITLWYQPELESLPEPMQAQMARKAQPPPPWWPADAQHRLQSIMSRYDGPAEPYGRSPYRRLPDRSGR